MHKIHDFGLLKTPIEFEDFTCYYIGTQGGKPYLSFLYTSRAGVFSDLQIMFCCLGITHFKRQA